MVLVQNTMPEWTLPGLGHRGSDPCVDREPGGVGAHRGSHEPVRLLIHGRGRLSSRTFWGAGRLQGPGKPLAITRETQRLDPDGWLVRTSSETDLIESPAALETSPGDLKQRSPVRRARLPRMWESLCPLDTRLLMGGTIGERPPQRCRDRRPRRPRLHACSVLFLPHSPVSEC